MGSVNSRNNTKNNQISEAEDKLKKYFQDFPGGTVVKNPPVNAGDTGSVPRLGRSHMPRNN